MQHNELNDKRRQISSKIGNTFEINGNKKECVLYGNRQTDLNALRQAVQNNYMLEVFKSPNSLP